MRYLIAAVNAYNLNPATLTQVNCVASATVDESQLDGVMATWIRSYGEGTAYNCRVLSVPLTSTTEGKLAAPPITKVPFKF